MTSIGRNVAAAASLLSACAATASAQTSGNLEGLWQDSGGNQTRITAVGDGYSISFVPLNDFLKGLHFTEGVVVVRNLKPVPDKPNTFKGRGSFGAGMKATRRRGGMHHHLEGGWHAVLRRSHLPHLEAYRRLDRAQL